MDFQTGRYRVCIRSRWSFLPLQLSLPLAGVRFSSAFLMFLEPAKPSRGHGDGEDEGSDDGAKDGTDALHYDPRS